MPMHDWTRIDPSYFPEFHGSWQFRLKDALNAGILPAGYFAVMEKHAGVYVPDIVATGPAARPANGTAVAEGEPRSGTRFALAGRRRRVMPARVQIWAGRRIVAVIEIVSPGNKDRPGRVRTFAGKVTDLLYDLIHVTVLDVLPPGPADPGGMHAAVARALGVRRRVDLPPADKPLTFVAYDAVVPDAPVGNLYHLAVGDPLPAVPLFLDHGAFVELPLDETYAALVAHLPAELRAELG